MVIEAVGLYLLLLLPWSLLMQSTLGRLVPRAALACIRMTVATISFSAWW
jgi:hypothetical protein